MKKQIFSFLLALTLILTVIPVAVSAADEEARIGTTLYATLDQALTAAEDNDIVEVLKDCKSKGMTITKNITVKGMDGLEPKPMVTIESTQEPPKSGMVPGKDTSLTFENLRFYSTKNVFSFAAASADSTLTLKNCDVESNGYYCVFIDVQGITLNIEGGNYISNWGCVVCGSTMPKTEAERTKIAVNINGAVLTQTANVGGMYAPVSNGNGKSNMEINISNSTLNANGGDGACVKIGGNDGKDNITADNVLTIKNSTLNSSVKFGIYVERTTKTDITVEDSTLNLNSTKAGGACIKAGGGSGTAENVTLTVKGNKTQLNTKSQYCVYYQKTLNSAINLEGGKLKVEDLGQAAWAVSTFKTPENARAKVTVSGAEIDTTKLALHLDDNTDFSITAGKLNEDKSTLSFGGKKQTAQGNPFTKQLYAQYLKGTTAESASTNVRFAMQVPMTAGYERYGFLVSVGNRILLVGLANGEKILSVETATLYTAVYANGEKVGTDAEGCGWLALGIDGIPQADFGTEFSVRPYAVKDGTVLLGETYSFTVTELLSK